MHHWTDLNGSEEITIITLSPLLKVINFGPGYVDWSSIQLEYCGRLDCPCHLNGVLTNFLMSSPTIFSLIYWYKFLVIFISRKEPITTAELSTGNSFKAPQPYSSTLAITQWTVLISINVNFPKWTPKIWLLLIGSVVASRSEKKDSLWIFNGGRAGYSSRFWCQLWLIFKDQPKRTSNPFRSHSKKYQISAGSISIQYDPSIAHLTEGLPNHPRTRIRS